MDEASAFSAVPNYDHNTQLVMSDERLIQSIRHVINQPLMDIGQIDYFQLLITRYNIYMVEQPENSHQYLEILNDISIETIQSIVQTFDLVLMVDINSLETDQLQRVAYDLYQVFIYKRRALAREFLAPWLIASYREFYNKTPARCNDVLFLHQRKINPEFAVLLHRLRDVIHHAVFMDPPAVESYKLMQAMLEYNSEIHAKDFTRIYFGVSGTVPILATGHNTARVYFGMYHISMPEADSQIVHLSALIQEKGNNDEPS